MSKPGPPMIASHLSCPVCLGTGVFDVAAIFAQAMSGTTVDVEMGCWQFGLTADRYPMMLFRGVARIPLHRFGLALSVGRWPQRDALHTCDVKNCWNPTHLYEGDAAQNNKDRRERALSYGSPGETNHFAKLTAEEVEMIRQSADERGMLPRKRAMALAQELAVSHSTVYRAFTGRTFREDYRQQPVAREHWAKRAKEDR